MNNFVVGADSQKTHQDFVGVGLEMERKGLNSRTTMETLQGLVNQKFTGLKRRVEIDNV